jgi:uncharacterized membrane protein
MKKPRVLIAGESWIIVTTHLKGVDYMTTSGYEEAVEPLRSALQGSGVDVDFLPNHLAIQKFPSTTEEIEPYQVVILSDIGANTLLLRPETYLHSRTTPNRLDLLPDYVEKGGGLMMIGGYMSFTGLSGKANYRGTAIERALPVTLMPVDDRMEMPQGFSPEISAPAHPIMKGIVGPWPTLLGYNRVELKPEATLLLAHGSDPIAAAWDYGRGRAAVFTSDCAPHWGTPEFLAWPGYKTFFGQIVHWLSRAL